MDTTKQQHLDLFKELNRYDERDKEYPSDEVFCSPRRTLANGWRKFHASRDCGSTHVRFMENTSHRPLSERHEFDLYCPQCGHEIFEDEVLFIGGDWYDKYGIDDYHRQLEKLSLPSERILELGPDPNQEQLRDALTITRIEQYAGPMSAINFEQNFEECDKCENLCVPQFDGNCRMCYTGPITDRLFQSITATENIIRSKNNSTVHKLLDQINPLHPGDIIGIGCILWRRSNTSSLPKVVKVSRRFKDYDTDEMHYTVSSLTTEEQWSYSETQLSETFWDTGLSTTDSREHTQTQIEALKNKFS